VPRANSFQQRFQGLVEAFDGRRLGELLAVDEEGRRGADAEGFGRAGADGRQLVEKSLIGQALIEALLGEAGLLGDFEQFGRGVFFDVGPVSLGFEEALIIGRVLSPPAQRASMEAANARGSSGNSRKTMRTLPVSTYLVLRSGSTLVWNCLQWPQVMEAYSTIVTLASALPMTRSGNSGWFISASTATSVGPSPGAACSGVAWRPQRLAPMASERHRCAAVDAEFAEESLHVRLLIDPFLVRGAPVGCCSGP
jgi:hypothetical protein